MLPLKTFLTSTHALCPMLCIDCPKLHNAVAEPCRLFPEFVRCGTDGARLFTQEHSVILTPHTGIEQVQTAKKSFTFR